MRHCFLLLLNVTYSQVFSQENYEIQVYSSPTMAVNATIFELHSNYTFSGQKQVTDGVRPSHHAVHETVEITTGIVNNFEIGVYLFTNITPGYGFNFVGTHLRPRVTAPLSWKIPVGLSLSAEIGYQVTNYSDEKWNIELRPIVDKQWNKLYVSFNPTFGISIKGVSNRHTPVFEPNLKLTYQFFRKATLGIEYYRSRGY